MILISYDGSDDAQAAIDRVAELMPGAEATVVTVWEEFIEAMARSGSMGLGMVGGYPDPGDIDKANEEVALGHATAGAQRATAAGLSAQARCVARRGAIADTILLTAEALSADVVVMGTRGRSGVKSMLLGSVSHATVQHADRAVLIVPSPELSAHRHARLEHDAMPIA